MILDVNLMNHGIDRCISMPHKTIIRAVLVALILQDGSKLPHSKAEASLRTPKRKRLTMYKYKYM